MPAPTSRDGRPGPVAIDATPLLGPVSGIGRYVRALVDHVESGPDAGPLGLVTTSVRRGGAGVVRPDGSWQRSLRLPAALWHRTAAHGSRLVDLALRPARLWHMTNVVAPRPRALPYVVTVHDLAYLHLPRHVNPGAAALRRLAPQVLAGAAAVVTVSAATRDDLLQAYPWLTAPVVPVPLGVDPVFSAAPPPDEAPPSGGPAAEPYLVFVGTREPRKNLGTLVRAHARARATRPDTPRLLVVGRPGWGDDLDGEAADPAHVTLLPAVADDRLPALVRGAVALVAPSHREGFSLPVLEAMAAGTRVIASDIPAHTELLAGTGTLLPATDVDAWAHTLAAAGSADDDLLARVAAARARSWEHTWQRTAAGHVAVWAGVLSGGRAEESP